jgi:organic hydroperoxide reductase OsmC/OhrA
MAEHIYRVRTSWTGNTGEGTADYRSYARDHVLSAVGKPDIPGSSDPKFRGDPTRWNPEELLVASLSACHKLWYLHLCSANGIVVTAYEDDAEGVMAEEAGGAGQFTRVTLHPRVTISAGDPKKAEALHDEAHALCFIAKSVNFPVAAEGQVRLD